MNKTVWNDKIIGKDLILIDCWLNLLVKIII